MITCRLKRIFNALKYGLAIMIDGRGLSVHKPFCPYNLCAIGITDRLMSKTNAEERNFSCKFPYNLNRHARLFRVAWPRRYDNSLWFKLLYLLYRNLVITIDPHILTQLTKILNEVVSKGIVVVNHQ